MTEFPTLHTDRLILRQHLESDLEFLFEGLSNPAVTQYYDVSYASLEETKDQLKWVKNLEEQESGFMWVIIDDTSGAPCGAAGIYDMDRKHHKAEIGFWILPEFWGKGITIEAVKAIHDYSFNVLGINRVEAYVSPGNIKSKALLGKLKYTYDGLLRDYELKDDKFVSYDLFSILSSD